MKLKNSLISLLCLVLFFIFSTPIYAACYECERDYPGICNLPDRGPIINQFVGRNCYNHLCTWADACAPKTLPGVNCSTSYYVDVPSLKLTRYSEGESYNGSFVGCNNNNQGQNCFCNAGAALYGSVYGTVRCLDDYADDSCGARQVCTPDCSCAANTCIGQTCTGTCNTTCNGTLASSCTYSAWMDILNPTCGGATQYQTGTGTCGSICRTQYQGCRECQTCTDQCGQAKDCGGNCLHPDCNPPTAPTNIFPSNSIISPLTIETPQINLTWQDPAQPNGFTNFAIRIHDTTTAWSGSSCSPTNPTSFCQNLPTTTHSFQFPTSGSLVPGRLYHWWIHAHKTCPCSTDNGWSPSVEGYFIYNPNSPPIFDSLIIQNNNPSSVSSEVGNRNHICQNAFNNSRKITFIVNTHDPDGDEIGNIRLKWNGYEFTRTSLTDSGVATFTVEYLSSTLNNTGTYPLETMITDSQGHTTGWINTNRNFKIWDCKVTVSGNIYQSNDTSIANCSNSSPDFQTFVNDDINFNSLTFTNSTYGNKNMTKINAYWYTNSINNELIWGKTYGYSFNPDIKCATPVLRTPDNTNCQSAITLNNSVVDPYITAIPDLDMDFTTTIISDPWFQSAGGGINSLINIYSLVPSTCILPNCTPAISIGNPNNSSNNGTLFAQSITKGCASCNYGYPNNWYYLQTRSFFPENYNYQYFINRYKTTVYPNQTNLNQIITDTGGTGVAYIDGDLLVSDPNLQSSEKFFMVIVKNNININESVSQLNGIFMADSNINITGTSNDQLIINGILYSSTGNIRINRNFTNPVSNNTKPAVRVNYRPDLIFNLPSKLIKFSTVYKAGI